MIWGKLDYERLSMTLNNNIKIAWLTILNVKGWLQKVGPILATLKVTCPSMNKMILILQTIK
jgi:hypothetical protein